MFTALCQRLLEEGVVVPIEPVVNRGGSGLGGVLVGLDELRAGRVSGMDGCRVPKVNPPNTPHASGATKRENGR